MSDRDTSGRSGPNVAFLLGNSWWPNGNKRNRIIKVDPEDIIAAGIVFVAIIFAIFMVFGLVPINKYTAPIIACSGGGAVIAQIVKARRKKPTRTPWIEHTVLVVLMLVFGGYLWASWGWLVAQFK